MDKNLSNTQDYVTLLKFTNDCGIPKSDIDSLLKLFKKYDVNKIGHLAFHDYMDILHEQMGHTVKCKDKIFRELENKNSQKLDFQMLIYVYKVCKDHNDQSQIQKIQQYSEFVDAFVALGGDPDTRGVINKQTIYQVLKNEFEMTIDIDDILEKLDLGSDDLDFESFIKLFDIDDSKKMSKVGSVLSLLSHRSKVSVRSNSSIKTVKVRQRDFELFLQKFY